MRNRGMEEHNDEEREMWTDTDKKYLRQINEWTGRQTDIHI